MARWVRGGLLLLAGCILGAGLAQWRCGQAPSAPSQGPAATDGVGGPPAQARAERAAIRGRAAEPRALEALPYVDGTYDPQSTQAGVLLAQTARTAPGYNLYCSRDLRSAILLDMAGKVVRRWQFPIKGVDHCEVLGDGSVIGLIQDRELVKLDARSRVVWRYAAEVHHAFWQTARGEIYVLARRPRRFPALDPALEVYDDLVQVLSPEGIKLREFSLLEAFWTSPYRFLLPTTQQDPGAAPGHRRVLDLLHANQVQVLDGSQAGQSPLFAAGNLLVSLRNVSSLVILDPTGSQLLWLWGPGNLAYQHQPTLLPNGNLLVFDNGVNESRVLELAPLIGRAVWSFAAGKDFFSATRGSCQRLPNGNTLITESNKGYVFEVTPAGEKVWVWANPLILSGQKRAYVWRMERYSAAQLPFLAGG